MRKVMQLAVAVLIAVVTLVGCPGVAAGQDKSAELAEARRLEQQVAALYTAGRYKEAIPLAVRSVELRKSALGPRHREVGLANNNLAVLYYSDADYKQAEQRFKEALEIRTEALGPRHGDVADSLQGLAVLYYDTGDYDQSKALFKRAIDIYKEALGPKDRTVAVCLNGLAQVYADEGDLVLAEQLFGESLEIKTTPDTLHNLGLLYAQAGDYERAEPLLKRSLKIREEAFGPNHPDVANSLNSLASLYESKRDYAQAEPLYKRAMTILISALGPKHTRVAGPLTGLATLYNNRGDYTQAESLYEQALSIREGALGPNHPDIAILLENIALTRRNRGDYSRAESLYKRALSIREAALPPRHPLIASTLIGLAMVYGADGDYAKATQFLTRANQIREAGLALILITGSERQKQLYINTLTAETYVNISLSAHAAPGFGPAARLALETVLQRKGRALDAMADQIGALRRNTTPEERALLDRLTEARTRLATLQISGGGRLPLEARREAIVVQTTEVERLEGEVSRRSAEFNARPAPVTREAVRQAIPAGAALVEIVRYLPCDLMAKSEAERWGAPRYLAYVERRGAEVPQYVDLGEAASIDAEAQRLRAALRNPDKNLSGPARALDERLMRPVRKLLGPIRRILLSPDAELNLIPFAALVDENGKYLVETYSLTYLTSGRDLLRLQKRNADGSAPLIIADPFYDLPSGQSDSTNTQGGQSVTQGGENRRSLDFTLPKYQRLSGTGQEAEALRQLLPNALVLTKEKAVESALKQVRGPLILHIATHGFFLPYQQPRTVAAAPGSSAQSRDDAAPTRARRVENPLLRSGLVLAGANQLWGGQGEDGVFTALEASGLDLRGTKLVVLSACETGLGDVRSGEGVYGLRRALILAGSESQVISLWKVRDEATRDFMIRYYKLLLAGGGRSEALRRVQLQMIAAKSKGQTHPYFWAGFIESGDWRNLNGK